MSLLEFAQVTLSGIFLYFHLSLKWSWRKIFFFFNFYLGEKSYDKPFCTPFDLDNTGQSGYSFSIKFWSFSLPLWF